jgi:hypothetical protein
MRSEAGAAISEAEIDERVAFLCGAPIRILGEAASPLDHRATS